MEENMTDKQMEILLTLVADKFSACKTMEDVEAAVKEVREMAKKEKGMSHEEVNSSCDIPLFCCLFQRNIQMIRLFLTFCLKKRRPPLPCLFGVLNLLNLCALL